MSYLNIDPQSIKLAGSGAKLQWGLAVGVVVDKIIGAKMLPDEENMLSEITSHLKTAGLNSKISDPSRLSAAEKHAIDGMLSGAGTKLTTSDLHKVFTAVK